MDGLFYECQGQGTIRIKDFSRLRFIQRKPPCHILAHAVNITFPYHSKHKIINKQHVESIQWIDIFLIMILYVCHIIFAMYNTYPTK